MLAVATLGACADGSSGDPTSPGDDAGGTSDGGRVDVDTQDSSSASDGQESEQCDASLRPIVLVHGFLGAADEFQPHALRFFSNGYCVDSVAGFDWNTLDRDGDYTDELDAMVDAVLARTGAAQVDLVGHSAGGGLSYTYLADPGHAAKVARYAHVASFVFEGPAGPDDAPIPTLNLWSAADTAIEDAGEIDGATNIELPDTDHYALATSEASFEAIYTFLNEGTAPSTTDVVPAESVALSGRALTFGENVPAAGATVQVWQVDSDTGMRLTEEPDARFEATEDGAWGPFDAVGGAHYEMRVEDVEEGTPVHYYFEPFVRSSPLVYLRTLPGPGSVAGLLIAILPLDHSGSTLVVYNMVSAVLTGRDSLTIDGLEVSTEALASAENTTIAMFFFDANRNEASDETTVAAFDNFPFLSGFDLYFAADPAESIEVVLNDSTLHTPRWSPEDEGASILIFR